MVNTDFHYARWLHLAKGRVPFVWSSFDSSVNGKVRANLRQTRKMERYNH